MLVGPANPTGLNLTDYIESSLFWPGIARCYCICNRNDVFLN